MSGDSGGGTNTTIAEPSAEVKPYLDPYLSRASELSNKPYQAYTGQTVASQNPYQLEAYQMIADRARAGSPVQAQANTLAQNTLAGNYLSPDSNPWFQNTVDQAMGQAQGRLNSQFNSPGAFGGSAHQQLMSRELGNIANQMYSQNYQNERQNMMGAMNFAPTLAAADYADPQALSTLGDINAKYDTAVLQDAYNRYLQEQQYPGAQLDILGNAIGQTMGAGGKTTAYGAGYNPYAQLAGGGLLAAGMFG